MSVNCKICHKPIKDITPYPHIIEENYIRKDIELDEVLFDLPGPHIHFYYECKDCNYKFLKDVAPLYTADELHNLKKEGKAVNERMSINYWKKWLKNKNV